MRSVAVHILLPAANEHRLAIGKGFFFLIYCDTLFSQYMPNLIEC